MNNRYCQFTTAYLRYFKLLIPRLVPESKPDIRVRVINLITAVCVLTLCVVPFSVFGQTEPEIKEGDRVRVSAAGEVRGTFVLQSYKNDTLILRDASSDKTIRLNKYQIRRLRVSQGPRSPGAGFLHGGGIGLAIGAGAGAIGGYASGDDPPGFLSWSASEKAVIYGLTFGVLGSVTGGMIGLIWPGERWERVDLNLTPANSESASAVFTFSYRF